MTRKEDRETSKAMGRRPGHILSDDRARQANLEFEAASGKPNPTMGQCGCLVIMMMDIIITSTKTQFYASDMEFAASPHRRL